VGWRLLPRPDDAKIGGNDNAGNMKDGDGVGNNGQAGGAQEAEGKKDKVNGQAGGGQEPAPNNDNFEAKPVTVRFPEGDILKCLALSPDGLTIAVGGKSDSVELRHTLTRDLRAAIKIPSGRVYSLAFAPDGNTLAVGSDEQILLWDVVARKERTPLKGHKGPVSWVGFRDGGKTLASIGPCDKKYGLILWDVDKGTEKDRLHNLSGQLVLSPDGKYLAEYSISMFNHGCFLKTWEVNTGKEEKAEEEMGRKPLKRLECRFYSLVFSPDSRTLVGIMGADRGLYKEPEELMLLDVPWILKPEALKPEGQVRHDLWIRSVAISPDGRTLASGGMDGKTILWDVATKKTRAALPGHTGPVRVCFSSDGKTLATYSDKDAFVKLWDVATGKERVEQLPGHGKGVIGLWFAAKGQTLAVLYQDQTVKLWRVPPPAAK
jgi:WD40 repeat protein